MYFFVLFIVVFVIGPLLFRSGLNHADLVNKARFLMLVPALLGVAGWGAKVLAGAAWGRKLWATVPGIALVWLGWIGLLVFCAARIQVLIPSAIGRKWTRALGAIGTTVPWFGLASAQMMTG
ncbi:MAG: hypothetical protein ABJL99_22810 [Aliishimia sp.]